ncbi:biopolymer transporter ExbD [Herbaspirillum sp. YR522]|uniref:biopolymer transporter ExbD n=1 Tax=Herbaspirillum sp. YR522 TaxID=1144342 RepID=UPI00026FBC48|nr:biopolymer transporter ExbD [Herbaspirillum sp. YR522]EJN02684.1 biopolymer transport protein [Herbaspirillum sp. YR522]
MAGSSMRGGRPRKFKSEINVVPYIDVMLVLLIIFMVAAPVTNPSVINLPTAGKSTQPPADYIEIALKPNTQATIRVSGPKSGGKKAETVTGKVDLAERLQALHADNPELAVMISADKEIKYDEVVQVISEAKKQGIVRVGLATK